MLRPVAAYPAPNPVPTTKRQLGYSPGTDCRPIPHSLPNPDSPRIADRDRRARERDAITPRAGDHRVNRRSLSPTTLDKSYLLPVNHDCCECAHFAMVLPTRLSSHEHCLTAMLSNRRASSSALRRALRRMARSAFYFGMPTWTCEDLPIDQSTPHEHRSSARSYAQPMTRTACCEFIATAALMPGR